jgi:hypothetical protein
VPDPIPPADSQTPAPPANPAPMAATAIEANLRAENQRLAAEQRRLAAELASAQSAQAAAAAPVKEQLIRARVEAAAVREGLVSPGLARYLPIDGASVDANGTVSGIETVIQRWRTDAPEVFKPTVVGQPPAAPHGVQQDGPPPPPVAKTFGPGHIAPPTNTPAAPTDVRKMTKADRAREWQNLRAAAATRDNVQ